MTSVSHEEALEILAEAGDEVTLTVKHYKSAAPFLLKNVRQLIPEQQADQDGRRRSSAASQRTMESPSDSVTSGDLSWNGIPKVKRNWVDVIEVKVYYGDDNNWLMIYSCTRETPGIHPVIPIIKFVIKVK